MGNYSAVKYNCASNGEGVRTAIYLSGCNLHCKGCFNYTAWDFESGENLTDAAINNILTETDKPYISGISILGGEPMDERNQESTYRIMKAFRQRFGNSKTIWMWTGYNIYGNLPVTKFTSYIFEFADVIVDGPFIQEKADVTLKFRGSSNQRILKKENGDY